MKQLKLLMFILLAITIGSCYSIESDCASGNNIEDDFWERIKGSEVLIPLNLNAWSITVTNNGYIWVYYYTSGIYLSTNNGSTWVQKNNGFSPGYMVTTIAINPINGYIFAGTDYGLYRSNDQGESWERVTSNMSVHNILITASGEIYYGVRHDTIRYQPVNGVYYSSNNGNTWINKSNGLPNNHVTALALGKDGTLYVGTYSKGIYRSTDAGNSWLLSSNDSNINVSKLTVSDKGTIFATGFDGVLKSTNRGDTWTEVVLSNVDRGDEIIYNTITKDIFVLCNHLSHYQLYRSTDLGVSWESTMSGLPKEIYVMNFTFNPNTGQMYLLTSNGLYRSKM